MLPPAPGAGRAGPVIGGSPPPPLVHGRVPIPVLTEAGGRAGLLLGRVATGRHLAALRSFVYPRDRGYIIVSP